MLDKQLNELAKATKLELDRESIDKLNKGQLDDPPVERMQHRAFVAISHINRTAANLAKGANRNEAAARQFSLLKLESSL